MLRYSALVIALMLAVSCVPVHKTAVVFPSDDTWVWEFVPWNNYGSEEHARIGKISFNSYVWWMWWEPRTYEENRHMWTALKFDLTPYSGTLIDSAKVCLYVYYTYNTFPPNEVWVSRCTADWDEDVITWENKPGYDSQDWHVPPAPVYAWWTIDVTEWVQEWLYNIAPNYGIWIGTNCNNLDFFYVYTKESSVTAAAPQLILYYTEYTSDSTDANRMEYRIRGGS
jgi:hypothetical protein